MHTMSHFMGVINYYLKLHNVHICEAPVRVTLHRLKECVYFAYNVLMLHVWHGVKGLGVRIYRVGVGLKG